MTKICKKSLALLLALAVCVSAMVCGVIVSAETPTPTITLVADKEAPVPGDTVQITAQVADFSAVFGADIEITLPAGLAVTEDKTVAIGKDDEIYYNAEKNTLTYVGLGDSVEIAENGSVVSFDPVGVNADGKLFAFTFVVPQDATPDTKYVFEFSATDPQYKAVRYCGAEENEIVPTTTGVTVAVASAHTHSYTSVVTTRPTITETGLRTYTCECGVSYTEVIPVAAKIETTFGHDIALNSSIDVGFTFKTADTNVDNAVDYYAVVTKPLYDGDTIIDYAITNYDKTAIVNRATGSTPRKVFVYDGITAKDMVTPVSVVVYFENQDGSFTYISEEYKLTNYIDGTITQYGGNFEGSTKSKLLITLLMDMVNYGAAAQAQFNCHPSALPTAAYADYLHYASESVEYNTVADNTDLVGATHKLTVTLQAGSTISILSAVRLSDNTKITSIDALAGYRAKCVYDDGATELWIDSSDFIIDGGEVKIKFDKFTTRHSLKAVNITLYQGDTPVSNTRTYSIASYASGVKGLYEVGTALRTLADNMIKFCNAADAYFGA